MPFFILFLAKVKTELNGCNEIVISDCDRNHCDRQSEDDFPSAEFCQLTCQFMGADDSCLSWAFKSAEKVNIPPFTLHPEKNLKWNFAI